MRTARILVDLTYGDAGKGAWTDYFMPQHDIVIQYAGGPQAAHRARGVTLHHFSAAVLHRKQTFLSRHCVISPLVLMEQISKLEYYLGISPAALSYLLIDPNAVIATPYHAMQSRSEAASEGRSSCGTGNSTAQRYRHGEDAIYAKDMVNKLALEVKLARQEQIFGKLPYRSYKDVAKDFAVIGSHFNLQSEERIFRKYQKPLFVGAAGVLIDREVGFKPYVTQTDVVPRHAIEMVNRYNVKPEIIGLTRSYMVRHGAGPFPTEDERLTVPEADNFSEPMQGAFRRGWLDTHLLNYAICEVEKLEHPVASLAMSHLDCVQPWWKVGLQHRFGDKPVYTQAHSESYLRGLVESQLSKQIRYLGYGPTASDRKTVDD